MAVKFRFNRDWDYDVRDKKTGGLIQTFAYKKGDAENVLEAHAAAAEEAGVGERVTGKAAKADDKPAGKADAGSR